MFIIECIKDIINDLIQMKWYILGLLAIIFAFKNNKNTGSTKTIYQGNSWTAARKAVDESIENNNETPSGDFRKNKDEDGSYVEKESTNTSGNSIWYGIWKK